MAGSVGMTSAVDVGGWELTVVVCDACSVCCVVVMVTWDAAGGPLTCALL